MTMSYLQSVKESSELEGYMENRRIALIASEKLWRQVRGLWGTSETDVLSTAVMIGFHIAVQRRLDKQVSIGQEAMLESNEAIAKFVESFSPSSLVQGA